MEAKSRQTDIKMTARKLRRVINEVRGKSVVAAQDMLRFMPYFAARVQGRMYSRLKRTSHLTLKVSDSAK